MARAPKKPGVGHNGGLPDHGDIRTAAAMEMIYEDKEKALRDEKKRARSRLVEGKGLLQDDMKFLKGLRDKSATEVIDVFKRQWHTVGAFYPEAHDQMDLFTKKSEAPVRAAYFTMGLLVGLQGKDLEIPPMVVGDDRDQMIQGHNEGRERHAAALTGILGQALDNAANGKATDGTTGAAINETANKDFAADNGGDPLVVAGQKYPNMRQANAARKRLEMQGGAQPEPQTQEGAAPEPEAVADETKLTLDVQVDAETLPPKVRVVPRPVWDDWSADHEEWTGPQKMEFKRWFDSQPSEFTLATTHDGAEAYFKVLREQQEAEFETPDLSEAGIAAAAAKLQKSGFVPPKADRQRRTRG